MEKKWTKKQVNKAGCIAMAIGMCLLLANVVYPGIVVGLIGMIITGKSDLMRE